MREFALCLVAILVLATPAAGSDRLSGNGWSLSISWPKGEGPFPAVVLLPGCSGGTPAAVAAGLRDHARKLRSAGYAAAILDVLGGRSICSDLESLTGMEATAARAANAAARELARNERIDPRRLGMIGQSFGGSVALRVARGASPFRAVVAYYPWCRSGGLRVPALIMTGSEDTWTPVSRCRGLGAQVVTFPGAVHSFDLRGLKRQNIKGVGGDYPVAGDSAAAQASQSRYISFFNRALR